MLFTRILTSGRSKILCQAKQIRLVKEENSYHHNVDLLCYPFTVEGIKQSIKRELERKRKRDEKSEQNKQM